MTRQMKDSGIEFIGEIPEEWQLIKVKRLFEVGRGRVIAKTELDDSYPYPVYSSQTKKNGILGYIETYDFKGPRLTWTTDGENAGTVFIRDGKYNCTNICGTLLLKEDDNDLRYLKYTLEYIAVFHKRADTNGYKIMNNEMANIEIVLASKNEQKDIADFLDKKTGEIDRIIANSKQAIEEYKIYKQALITETVTKGLDKSASKKDSGVEWIGDIPEHWNISKIKNFYSVVSGTTPKNKDENWNGKILWITPADYNTDDIYITNSNRKITELGVKNSSLSVIPINSIIVSNRAPIGKIALNSKQITINQGCKALISTKVINNKYTYYVLSIYKDVLNMLGKGTTFLELSSRELGDFTISIPTLNDQAKIVTYLDEKTSQIDEIISKKEKLVEEMEAYKKSLIFETVTGKREVD